MTSAEIAMLALVALIAVIYVIAFGNSIHLTL